jgi:uroporphyrinogen-III synthase
MRPLEGRVILVTRARRQADPLVGALTERGAVAIAAPAIEILPASRRTLDAAVEELLGGAFEWILLTSRTGVDAVFERMGQIGQGALLPASVGVGAIGEGTAAALRERGIEPALVPRRFTTEALGSAMPRGTGRVLLARADIAPEGLESVLRRKGWTPVRVEAYRTKLARSLPMAARRALTSGRVDAITFTSASTVAGFLRASGSVFDGPVPVPKVVCIGPVTAHTARQAGLRVDAVARPHTIEGLLAAVERALRPRSGTGTLAGARRARS